MAWRVNEDRPDWTVIHSAASRDNRCQPKNKQEGDGRWHNCQTEQELIELIPIIVERSGPRIKACKICRPVIPATVQSYLIG